MSDTVQSPSAEIAAHAKHTRCLIYDGTRRPRHLTELGDIGVVLRDSDSFVWLDIVDPSAQDFALFEEEFGLHPLAVEDAVRAHERPKVETYKDSWFFILHGATRDADKLRIHEFAVFVGAKFLVTARTVPDAYPLDEVQKRWDSMPSFIKRDSGALLFTIIDTVVDGYTAIADALEERVALLESALLGDPRRTDAVLLEIYEMKKNLTTFRQAVVPVRDILNPILRGDLQLFEATEFAYFRDVHDHVNRVVDQLDGARELINNARDTHISMATNRQNEVTKQLTIVATIFLPLSYITGFFGQNFSWLTNNLNGPVTFAVLGIGSEILAVLALVAYFRFKRWF
jgi:magnesium transporter